MPPTTIPARSGVYVLLHGGQTLKVINTHGHQVVDTWAFVLPSPSPSQTSANASPQSEKFHPTFAVEYMSMCHSRAAINALRPSVGSTLVTNKRAPVLTLTTDTSGGVHDTVIAACDIYRYRGLIPDMAEDDYHDNCSDNLQCALDAAAADRGLEDGAKEAAVELRHALRGWTPDPFNLFMNIPWDGAKEGNIGWEPPVCKAGGFVELRAERERVLVCMSACPQDVLTINGGKPVDAAYEVS